MRMRISFRFAAATACVAVTCGALFFWRVHQQKAIQQKTAEFVRVSRARAEQGDAVDQCRLGDAYREGNGVLQNYTEAVRWYRAAADQGYARAQYSLGNMYREGFGVPQNTAEAVRWYRKAADQDYTMAQSGLGYMYDRGEGVTQSYMEAVRWCRRAADRGDPMAQSYLGFSYAQGRGVPQDYAEAVRWYRKAAEQGYADAQYALGFMYHRGEGVPQNDAEAVRWYSKAVDRGKPQARQALRSMYCTDGLAQLKRWTSIVVILLAVPILIVPRRLWKRAMWLPWALCSALCAVAVIHQLRLSALSLALLVALPGPLGAVWRGAGLTLVPMLLGGGAAVLALVALKIALLGSKRGGNRDQIPPPRRKLRSEFNSSYFK